MSRAFDALVPAALRRQITRICADFEVAWRSDAKPSIEEYLDRISPDGRQRLLAELIQLDIELHNASGETVHADRYLVRFPTQEEVVRAVLARYGQTQSLNSQATEPSGFSLQEPSSRTIGGETTLSEVLPERIGKYAVKRLIGSGGYAKVYLAVHPHLGTDVALKVARTERFRSSADLERFLDEARHTIDLRHSRIVAVYDVDVDAEKPFIVQEYVEGGNLSESLGKRCFTPRDAGRLVADIAEAVAHAHAHGLYHRDLKPNNILLDTHGQPKVADFGLALHADLRRIRRFERAGTPAYMAPEQVRGESHRVDGRCDIWSLGVILYELLVGHRPFRGRQLVELFDNILSDEPQPMRQVNPDLPVELERICQKCLAKRMADRYTTAKDLRDDLTHWLDSGAPTSAVAAVARKCHIVPKGLRSFDDEDADFYLELLPGPRDRDGLPDSLRFWKSRLEQTDPDRTFSVGLIYGPSGSGKSSFIKAGLLPRLGSQVLPLYLEATADDTERRVARELKKQLPAVLHQRPLDEILASLREDGSYLGNRKLVVLFDQFEQWLHGVASIEESSLVRALRHCDGERLQCVIMVRDDFWMAATRFLHALEIELVQGHNVAAVDRFDMRHARRVLKMFGQAYGTLPENDSEHSRDQQAFLDHSVEALGEDGRVISVRLALFADMIKGKPWSSATFRSAGGAEGIGVTFLEDTFISSSANPRHRLHARAAQDVLRSLLPPAGVDIKGNLKSHGRLLAASRYDPRKRDFGELIDILDGELRLITPADPIHHVDDSKEVSSTNDEPSYQLTHDYLIPELRDWLGRKQRETRRGRAEIRLTERTALWTSKPETRQLPSGWEWLNIRMLTRPRNWSTSQRRLMRRADRHHLTRLSLFLSALALLVAGGLYAAHLAGQFERRQSMGELIARLSTTDAEAVPELLDKLETFGSDWVAPVTDVAGDAKRSLRHRTAAHLALARHAAPADVQFLVDRLLEANVNEHQLLLTELMAHHRQLVPKLWQRVNQTDLDDGQLLRAATALARYDTSNPAWQQLGPRVVPTLLRLDSLIAKPWVEALRPAGRCLLASLTETFKDPRAAENERVLATYILANYATPYPGLLNSEQLADLLLDANPTQYEILFPVIRFGQSELSDVCRYVQREEVPRRPATSDVQTIVDGQRELLRLLHRQSNAALTLCRLGHHDEFWPLLERTDDPRLRTRLIARLVQTGIPWGTVLEHIDRQKNPTIRQALVLGLASYGEQLSEEPALASALQQMFETDPHGGVHSAVEWLMKERGFVEELDAAMQKLRGQPLGSRAWFINPQGITMIILDPPETFRVGSPEYEHGRDGRESVRHVSLNYTFAISAHEVTVNQYRELFPEAGYARDVTIHEHCPMNSVSFYDASRYCRWLSDEDGTIPDDRNCLPPRNRITSEARFPDFQYREGYRLPLADEWEFAARAGSLTSRFFGDDPDRLVDYAWYSHTAAHELSPVGRKQPNAFGLFDIYGNVSEICVTQVSAGGAVQTGARGGHYYSTPRFIRSAMPGYISLRSTQSFIGFRVARRMLLKEASDAPGNATGAR